MVHSANNKPLIKLFELTDLPTAQNYFIAYSGGMDSTALLHALSLEPKLNGRVTAIHVNHNINPKSKDWAHHCLSTCNLFNIPLITASVELEDHSEAACRQARQDVFRHHLNQGDCLMTAHHQNDQVETVLFRLFRGTGIGGMTGISKTNQFDHYCIYRPLLSCRRSLIKDYVEQHQLSYVEDPSNQNNNYSRNHIRNIIIPALEAYEARVLQNVELTANNIANSLQLLKQLIGNHNPLNYLQYKDVDMLSTALYHWLNHLNVPTPSHKRLNQFSHDCLTAAADKNPQLLLNDKRLIRWNNQIYGLQIMPALASEDLEINLTHSSKGIILPDNGQLVFKSSKPIHISAVIKYQQSHERIQLDHNGQHKKLKKLFQQHVIPPWERPTIPYLYIDKQLMAVGSKILSIEFKVLLSQYNAEYHWLSPQHVL